MSGDPTVDLAPSVRWRAYSVCLLGWLFDFYDLVLFAYLAAAIGKDFGWGDAAPHYKALLVGVALALSGAGGIFFGGLADRYGRRRVMVWTILVYSLGTGLSGLSVGLLSLMAFRAITGFGVGGEWATGHALMAEIFPKEKRGFASALLQAGEPIGVALAVLAGLWLAPRLGPHGWRWVFFISALPAALVLLVRWTVPESPLWLQRRARGAPGFVEQYRILWRDHRRRALQGWILGASKLGTYWLTYVWLPEYFAEIGRGQEGGGSFSRIRLTFILVAQGGQLVGMLLFGLVSDRIGRRPAFCAYSLLTAGGLFALASFGKEMLAHPEWFWPAMGAVRRASVHARAAREKR